MNWKKKAKLQRFISYFPSSVSYEIYYFLQKKFGGLKSVNYLDTLRVGVYSGRLLADSGFSLKDKFFLEIGTGRVPVIPVSFWLMGAKKTFTFDLNPYVKAELVKDFLNYIVSNPVLIEKEFGDLLSKERFSLLLNYISRGNFSLESFLELTNIKYVSPGDAAKTELSSGCIDFHFSTSVLEHIPMASLEKIFFEGDRLLHKNGLFIHRVDYSDHFSHSDSTISSINFLQYSSLEWEKYAGNRYMYTNRLRHDDFVAFFEKMNHDFLLIETERDPDVPALIVSKDFNLDEEYQDKTEDVLSIRNSWFLSKKSF